MSARRNPRVELSHSSVAALVEPLGVLRAFQPLSGGYANTALRLELAERAEPLVLRVVAGGPQALARELAVLDQAAGRVPVPEVLLSAADHEGHACVVQRFVEGVELGALLERGEERSVHAAGVALGRALAALHAQEFSGSGWLVPDAACGLRVEPWPEAKSDAPLRDYARATLAGRAGRRLGEEWRARCAEVVERHRHALSGSPCFVHGDFNPSNVLLSPDGRELRAILDWEWAHAGSPYSDLGNLTRARAPGGPAPALCAGVAAGYGELADDWRLRARLVDLSSQLEFLGREDDGLARAFDVVRILQDSVAALEAEVLA